MRSRACSPALSSRLTVGCIIIFALFAVSGCGPSYPLDMTEAEWTALSPEQQMDARNRQLAIEIEQRAERARRQADRERQQVAAKQAERERIERIIAQRVPGSIIDCAIEGGAVKFALRDDRETPQPVAFTVVRGEGREVELTTAPARTKPTEIRNLWVVFDAGGRELAFCPITGVEADHPSCDRTAVLGSELETGFTRRFTIPEFIRDGRIRCENAVPRDTGREIIISN